MKWHIILSSNLTLQSESLIENLAILEIMVIVFNNT